MVRPAQDQPHVRVREGPATAGGPTRWTLIVALVAAALNDSHNHAGTDEHRSYRKARWVVRDAWQPAMFDHDPAPARAGPDIAA